MSKIRKPFDNSPQFMSLDELEKESLYCLDFYFKNTGHNYLDGFKIKAEQICEHLLDVFGYELIVDKNITIPPTSKYWKYTEGNDVVGYTDFLNKEVHVKQKLLSDRMAIVHETKHCAHDGRFPLPFYQAKNHEKLETQASNFARFFLLPRYLFESRFNFLNKKTDEFENILAWLMYDFKVSGRVILIRSLELNLISEKQKTFYWYKNNSMSPSPSHDYVI